MAKDHSQSIFQLCKDQNLVSLKDGKPKPIKGTGRFLKPCVQTVSQAITVPNTPLLFEIFSDQSQTFKKWPESVEIKGWHYPQKRWEEWVDKMAGKYGALWKKTGICDAIMSSTYEIRCNKDLILGLVEFWCPETNTFVFPWGEATVTLEDVMILGGFSTLGDSVNKPLDGKLVKIEEEINKKRLILTRNKSRKASHSVWIKHFMEQDKEYEHIAFSSLWLARYVFPSLPEKVVYKQVFPIAIHLSSNTTMALSQAVLASLYKSLTLLKHQAMSFPDEISASGPLKLLQLWAFEHFPATLVPSIPKTLKPGEPRAARFHKLNAKISLQHFTSVIILSDNFIWRPYIVDLKNWGIPSYYKLETKYKTFDCNDPDEYLKSFARCLYSPMLVGLDCKEEYFPQRVAMQFGFDQDLPAAFPSRSISFESARFAVLPRSFEPCVSVRYSNWWRRSKLARETALRSIKRKVFDVKKPERPTKVPRKGETEGCCSTRTHTIQDCTDEVHYLGTISSQIMRKHVSSVSKVDPKGPVAMCSLKTNDTFSQVHDDNNSTVESLASAANDSDTDNIPLSERMNHVKAKRSKANTLTCHGSTAGRQMNAAGGGSKLKAIEGSLNGIGKEKKVKLVEGFSKNSNHGTFKDGCATTGSVQKFGLEIEGRLRRLERMIGI